jgi:exosortase
MNIITNRFFYRFRPEAIFLFLFLGVMWAGLINHLRVDWTINPQYGYGWVVPFLCGMLIWKRIQNHGDTDQPLNLRHSTLSLLLIALLYAPTRLIGEANPDWRLVSWALAIELVGLTLLLIYFFFGGQWMKRLAFPIAYFLVAVPWPGFVEIPLIQLLTRADAAATVEMIGWLGVPALTHGNIIEVATGEVGINDACSGIRSFQATLMISLFFCESLRLNYPRRFILILSGFALSFLFNQVRMTILVWVAAHDGILAIGRWHDPAGVSIMVACFFSLWGLGVFLARKKASVQPRAAEIVAAVFLQPKRRLILLLSLLLAWVVVVEISVEGWYRWHEQRLPTKAQWTVAWPTNNPTFEPVPVEKVEVEVLHSDDAQRAGWQANNIQWQAVYIRWNPGTRAPGGHTPLNCMPARGYTVVTISNGTWFEAAGFRFPFTVYQVMDAPQPFYIFYTMWNGVIGGQQYVSISVGDRLKLVRAGLRNVGYTSLEISLSGYLDLKQAETALQLELQEIIQVRPPMAH